MWNTQHQISGSTVSAQVTSASKIHPRARRASLTVVGLQDLLRKLTIVLSLSDNCVVVSRDMIRCLVDLSNLPASPLEEFLVGQCKGLRRLLAWSFVSHGACESWGACGELRRQNGNKQPFSFCLNQTEIKFFLRWKALLSCHFDWQKGLRRRLVSATKLHRRRKSSQVLANCFHKQENAFLDVKSTFVRNLSHHKTTFFVINRRDPSQCFKCYLCLSLCSPPFWIFNKHPTRISSGNLQGETESPAAFWGKRHFCIIYIPPHLTDLFRFVRFFYFLTRISWGKMYTWKIIEKSGFSLINELHDSKGVKPEMEAVPRLDMWYLLGTFVYWRGAGGCVQGEAQYDHYWGYI